MSTDPETTRIVRSWLMSDEHASATHVVEGALAEIETTPQRPPTPWPARRTPTMSKIVGFGLAAAAVVAIALIGSQVIGSNSGGVGADPTPIATREQTPEPVGNDKLPDGMLLLWDGAPDGVSITVTVSGDGWWGRPGQDWFTNDGEVNTPPGTGMIVYGSVDEYYVYGDPCHWQTTMPEVPATSVDEVVAALQSQTPGTEEDHELFGAWASEPRDISVDGHIGKSITLHAPSIFPHDCDLDQWAYFASEDESPERHLLRGGPDADQPSMQGQNDEIWIVDVNGAIVVLDIAYGEGTPQSVVDELRDMLASATFDLP